MIPIYVETLLQKILAMLDKGEISIRDTNLRKKNEQKKKQAMMMNGVMNRKLSLTHYHYHIEPFPSTPPPTYTFS